MREERFIAKVVEMHYKQGMSQQEIAKILNVSRAKISRAITKAKKEGYVEIRINHLDTSRISMEEKLENKFGLKEAIIASRRKDEDIGETVAFYAADYLLRIMESNMTLGNVARYDIEEDVIITGERCKTQISKIRECQCGAVRGRNQCINNG